MHEPMGFHDYNRLQSSAFCVVSDSGTLPEESSFFASVGMPFLAVCIRTSTERPRRSTKGVLHARRHRRARPASGRAHRRGPGRGGVVAPGPVPDYADECVSTKVVKIIQSYTGIVDKMVWRKRL